MRQLFIDFKKAYDSVRREALYNILIEFGIPKKLVRLIKMCLTETYSNRLGIVWGNFPLPQACFVQYADRTTYWPNIPNLHFTSLLDILSTSLFRVRRFCSRMGGNRICKIVGKMIIFQYFSTSVPQHLDLLFVIHI